ncbi:protein of unknown function [Methylorubrum extorquens]|uniref:Uncharacterized protein n=1 Tax=Methylorubrum extorquens TaxID=408 RepID=A0A2N9AZC5_METEX|nr:protein of unknown function [Methylorubrum extorquens]
MIGGSCGLLRRPSHDDAAALPAGALPVLRKPFALGDLRTAVERLLEGRPGRILPFLRTDDGGDGRARGTAGSRRDGSPIQGRVEEAGLLRTAPKSRPHTWAAPERLPRHAGIVFAAYRSAFYY